MNLARSGKNIFYISIVSAILLFFSACGEDKKENTGDKKTIPTETAEKEITPQKVEETPEEDDDNIYTLKYDFREGDIFNYNLTSITHSLQHVESDSVVTIKANQTIDYEFSLKVVNVLIGGIFDFEVTVNSVILVADMNGTPVAYNSKETPEGEGMPEYETLLNNPFRVKVSGDGEVIAVTNTDKLVEKFITYQPRKNFSREEIAQFESALKQEALKPLTQQFFRTLPENNIKVNDNWNSELFAKFNTFDITNIVDYKLKSVKDNIANIEINLGTRSEGKNDITEGGVFYHFSTPEIYGDGTMKFDIEKGLMTSSTTNMTVSATITMESDGLTAPAQKAVRTENTIKTNKVEFVSKSSQNPDS